MTDVIVSIDKLNDDDLYAVFEKFSYSSCVVAKNVCRNWKFISSFFLEQKEMHERKKLIKSAIKCDEHITKKFRASGQRLFNVAIDYKHANIIKEFWNKKKTVLVFCSMENKMVFLNLTLNSLKIPNTDISIVSCEEHCSKEQLSKPILLCTHCVKEKVLETNKSDIFFCFNGDVYFVNSIGYEFILGKGWEKFFCD